MKSIEARPKALVVLLLLGFASAVWAGFLWSELIVARTGGTPFCAADGKINCVQLWDSALASFVHERTKLPVAAWGVLWSVVALLFPLVALVQGSSKGPHGVARSAISLVAAVGALSVVGLVASSLAERTLCTGCLATHGLVSAYAVVAFLARPTKLDSRWRPAVLATGGAAALVYLALLYPGMSTPRSSDETSQQALALAESSRALTDLITALPPPVQETLATLLFEFSVAPALDEKPRSLVGDPHAPVILTEFSDALCGHCARLHSVLRELEQKMPKGSFALESRQFPLDAACNPNLPIEARGEGVRCLAAKVRICLEGNSGLSEFNERMFADQLSLDSEKLMRLATPYMDKAQLLACVESEETENKLLADIAYAIRHGIQGTPMVLINGRKGSAFPPFLLAVISARADPKHPAFEILPKPRAAP